MSTNFTKPGVFANAKFCHLGKGISYDIPFFATEGFMPTRCANFVVLLFLLLLTSSGLCQTPELSIACAPPEGCTASKSQICIDAATAETRVPVNSFSKDHQILVTVFNKNPFAYQYKLNLDEKTIVDDDVSGFFKLFLPSTQKTDVQPAKTTAKADSKNTADFMGQLNSEIQTSEVTRSFIPEHQRETGESVQNEADELDNSISHAGDQISSQIDLYMRFVQLFNSEAVKLHEKEGCEGLRPTLKDLDENAHTAQTSLHENHIRIVELISNITGKYAHLSNDVNRLSMTTNAKMQEYVDGLLRNDKSIKPDDVNESRTLLRSLQEARTRLDTSKQSALKLECLYLNFAKNQLSSIQSGVIDPLEQAASNPGNFLRTGAIGPYTDPTDVIVTNERKPVDAPMALPPASLQSSSSAENCSKELLTANDFAGVEFSSPSAPSGSDSSKSSAAPKQGSGKKTASSNSSKSTGTDDGYEPDGKAIVHFGGQRFITAAGIGFGFMQKPEFARVSGIPTNANGVPTSSTLTSIVGLKSESDIRFTPLLFLHTRMLSLNSIGLPTNEALFATFGIGAQADNQGARSEYFLGISQSFVDQHFFVGLGTYIGKQQVLKNGLFLGQDVSSLQGDLPIDQITHFKFGVTLSYRFTIGGGSSSKKDQSSTAAKSQ